MRKRFGEVTRHQFHDHQDVRKFVIRSQLDGLDNPIIVIGDSVAEIAKLPAAICGKPVVNAGIGGARTSDFVQITPNLLSGSRPALVVIALGANDTDGDPLRQDFGLLLTQLKHVSDKLLIMPTADRSEQKAAASDAGVKLVESNFQRVDKLADGVHMSRIGYVKWLLSLEHSIEATLSPCD